jgi:putative membrane protein
MSLSSYRRWERNERALRLDQPLPPSALPRILAYGVVILAIAATALAVVQYAAR